MASTVVHLAVAALLAAALLGDSFDRVGILVVLGAVAFIDLDAFVGIVFEGTHRAAFHTYLLPLAAGVFVYFDTRVREPARSLLRRWRPDGARVAWVALLAVAVAGIGLDMTTNGVNAFWPLHDQFFTVDGKFQLSDRRGVVQTFVDLQPEPTDQAKTQTRTTKNTHFRTGVDPSKGTEPKNVERIFPVVSSGRELLWVVAGYGSLGARLWERSGDE